MDVERRTVATRAEVDVASARRLDLALDRAAGLEEPERHENLSDGGAGPIDPTRAGSLGPDGLRERLRDFVEATSHGGQDRGARQPPPVGGGLAEAGRRIGDDHAEDEGIRLRHAVRERVRAGDRA